MANILSLEDHSKRLDWVIRQLSSAKSLVNSAIQTREDMFSEQHRPEDIDAQIVLLLGDISAVVSQASSDLSALPFTNATEIRPGLRADNGTGVTLEVHHFDIDVDNGSSKAEIEAQDAANNVLDLFGDGAGQLFAAGDIIEIYKAEDSANKGIYEVDSCTDSKLTLKTVILGGVDNTSDEKLSFRLIDG